MFCTKFYWANKDNPRMILRQEKSNFGILLEGWGRKECDTLDNTSAIWLRKGLESSLKTQEFYLQLIKTFHHMSNCNVKQVFK